jgi:hypothetical protein
LQNGFRDSSFFSRLHFVLGSFVVAGRGLELQCKAKFSNASASVYFRTPGRNLEGNADASGIDSWLARKLSTAVENQGWMVEAYLGWTAAHAVGAGIWQGEANATENSAAHASRKKKARKQWCSMSMANNHQAHSEKASCTMLLVSCPCQSVTNSHITVHRPTTMRTLRYKHLLTQAHHLLQLAHPASHSDLPGATSRTSPAG